MSHPPLFEVWKDGQTYAMTPGTLIDELTYSTYKFNRQRNPAITPATWQRSIRAFTEAMETRYQAEQAR